MNYCLDLSRLITGIGLIVDLIGISLLLQNELKLRNIENLKSRGADKSGLKYNEKRKKHGKVDPLSITNEQAMEAEDNHPPSKAKRLTNRGLKLILLGFFIQIIALFIYGCITIEK